MKSSNMASAAKLWSAIKASKTRKKGDDENLLFAEEMYEAGMKYVIEEMAWDRFYNQPDKKEEAYSPERREADKKAYEISKILRTMLTDEQWELVRQLEDYRLSELAYAEQETYIQGFFEGYKYVKELP